MGLASNEPQRKGDNRGTATLSGPSSQDYGEQIPNGLGSKPKAREILFALNQVITSQCPMDPMVAWETKDGEE